MLWIFIALVAHILNALVFVVDKSLLSTTNSIINQPARYAALSGLVAAGSVLILPLGFAWPNLFILVWSLLAGFFWVAALWFFFIALKAGESSRIVPLTGSAVPIFTLLIAAFFLGEQLTVRQGGAVLALIIGGVLISIRFNNSRRDLNQSRKVNSLASNVRNFNTTTFFKYFIKNKSAALPAVAALASALAFALHFSTMDVIYDRFEPFPAAFGYSRLGVGMVSLMLLVILMLFNKPESFNRSRFRTKARKMSFIILTAFLGSKLIGALALILQNYAIKLGSVTIVNSLQGTQYIFLLIVVVFVTRWRPQLFVEEIGRVAVSQKIAGIIVIGAGLILLF